MQAECIAAAYRLWRREWRGRGKEYTAGALVWQLNDCWPVTSWAICDYFLKPKPAFFAIKRELATYTVGLARKETTKAADEDTAANVEIAQEMEICLYQVLPPFFAWIWLTPLLCHRCRGHQLDARGPQGCPRGALI